MTTITIPTSLVVLAYAVLACELWQQRQTMLQIGSHLSIFGVRLLLIVVKRLYRLIKRLQRRIRCYTSYQAKRFAYHYPRVANSVGEYKPRRGTWAVPGLWLDRVLISGTLVVVGIAQLI